MVADGEFAAGCIIIFLGCFVAGACGVGGKQLIRLFIFYLKSI